MTRQPSRARSVVASGLLGFLGGALALSIVRPDPTAAQPVPTPSPPAGQPSLPPGPVPSPTPLCPRRRPRWWSPHRRRGTPAALSPSPTAAAPTPAVLVAERIVVVDGRGQQRAVFGALAAGDPARGTEDVYGVRLYDANGTQLVALLQSADQGHLVVGDVARPGGATVLVYGDSRAAGVDAIRPDGTGARFPSQRRRWWLGSGPPGPLGGTGTPATSAAKRA